MTSLYTLNNAVSVLWWALMTDFFPYLRVHVFNQPYNNNFLNELGQVCKLKTGRKFSKYRSQV